MCVVYQYTMYERSDDWCLCVGCLWFHHKCHPSKVHASTKHNMGKHAYRAVYNSIQYTEYRVNTESCFLWYVRAVLESKFSTNSTENRFPRWQHRALRGSRGRLLLPAGRSYTETSPQACSPHCVLCGSMQTFRSFDQQTSPCSCPNQTKPFSTLYTRSTTGCVEPMPFSTNSALRKYSGANHALESLQNMHSCSIYIQR